MNNTHDWTTSLASKQMICAEGEITGYNFVIKVECGGSQGLVFDVERTMMKDGTVYGRNPIISNYEAMVFIRMLRIFDIPNPFDAPDALISAINNVVCDCMKANLDNDPGVEFLVRCADIPRKVSEEFMKKYPGEANAQIIKQVVNEIMEEIEA